MTKWRAWISGLGDAVVNPGSPLGMSAIVSASGVAEDNLPNKVSGFSIVKADDFDSALDIAKACPYLEIGGTLRIAELMEMRPR